MYGYLRLLTNVTPSAVQSYYRGMYCSLCHSLWNNYGLRPRFLLSYDLTFLAIVADLESKVSSKNRFLCVRRTDFKPQEEGWKRLAALSILLASKKFEDDILDENDCKAKAALRIFRKAASKAEDEYEDIAHLCREGFREMAVMEKQEADLQSLALKFSQIMVDATSLLFSCAHEDIILMKHVTQWCYFVDALDDLDDDVKKNRYNPLKRYSNSLEELCRIRNDVIDSFITSQMDLLQPVIPHFISDEDRSRVIMSIIRDTISTVTHRILQGKKPYGKKPLILRLIESRGGYRLA
jgi:hypothetical protein